LIRINKKRNHKQGNFAVFGQNKNGSNGNQISKTLKRENWHGAGVI
jgi:hypothetical protein